MTRSLTRYQRIDEFNVSIKNIENLKFNEHLKIKGVEDTVLFIAKNGEDFSIWIGHETEEDE